ncbi:MAG: hypothetical protein V4448_06890 [Pseudomonadota bacterium]
MDDRQLKKISVADINAALTLYRGHSYVNPPTQVVDYENYENLTREQCDQGVIAFVHACNLSGGSVMDMDLYKLVRNYLRHPGARIELNAVVKRYEG